MTARQRARRRRHKLNADRRRARHAQDHRPRRGRSDVRAAGGLVRRRGGKSQVEVMWRRAFSGIITVPEIRALNKGNEPGMQVKRRPIRSTTSGAAKRRGRSGQYIATSVACERCVDESGGVTWTTLRCRRGLLYCPIHGGAVFV